jgi:dnd system-associated protein 4
MADIRINIPEDMEGLVRRLSGFEDNIGVFETLADTIAFAASYGYAKGKRKALINSASNPISQEIFRNKGLDTLINLIAVIDENDPLVLENSNEKEMKKISIFEEYAYGGLIMLKDELEGSADNVETILGLICDEHNDERADNHNINIVDQIRNL